MNPKTKEVITVEATIQAPIEKVWTSWTEPIHITKWNQASEDWNTPHAENDVRTGGKFKSTMAAKDGCMSFDFEGTYHNVIKHQLIESTIADGRQIKVSFTSLGNATKVVESFDAESENSIDLQRAGWQTILDSFKKYTEGLK